MIQKPTVGPWSLRWANHQQDGAVDIGIIGTIDSRNVVIAEVFGRVGKDIYPVTESIARVMAAGVELVSACLAAVKYDEAIRGRAHEGSVEPLSMDPSRAFAEGHDLDELYEDWMTKARAALKKAGVEP